MNILWYISGHGFGHATRCTFLINHILTTDSSARIEAVTLAPAHLFSDLGRDFGPACRFTLRQTECALDAGVLQSDALTIDCEKSLTTAEQWMFNDRPRFIASEIARLEQAKHAREQAGQCKSGDASYPDIILSDAAFAPLRIARTLGIPSAICTNFTWDAIYTSLWKTRSDAPLPAWIRAITQDYFCATKWLCEFGALDDDGVPELLRKHVPVATIPLFGRAAIQNPAALRARYNIPPSNKVALLTFGGHDSQRLFASKTLQFSKWTFVGAVEHPDVLYLDPKTTHIPDWMAVADVVVGKVGFGTCTEIALAGTPFFYVSRRFWIEEPALVKATSSLPGLIIEELPLDLFESGTTWFDHVQSRLAEYESLRPVQPPAELVDTHGNDVFWDQVRQLVQEPTPARHGGDDQLAVVSELVQLAGTVADGTLHPLTLTYTSSAAGPIKPILGVQASSWPKFILDPHARISLAGARFWELGRYIGTDIPDWAILGLAEANIRPHVQAAVARGEQAAECSVEALDWLADDIGPLPTGVDVIMAADVVYQDHLTDGFLFTLHSLLTANPSATAFICAEKRFNWHATDDRPRAMAFEYFAERVKRWYAPKWNIVEHNVSDEVLAAGGRIDEFAAFDGKDMILWEVTLKPGAGARR
ncbi:hypothetical protein AMAG_03450 [Allomyces macrogynus ATCC 38327]|uniref:Glycosyl transferase family 28 C-terminal domain-containing protein n=1 Tax=Allomyces macrogynus (strain ATCC 38327) TaxID=578462 RepID=A0A0L0S945_ALLM3|nr:hypothetical protein AMAG_03450 [Allomyces macrogynus ATCC 38327]|eukprot:KNE59108.1 hypothetical protein AMAG_03450 [Allomyces macrogynus ATCC 38327]